MPLPAAGHPLPIHPAPGVRDFESGYALTRPHLPFPVKRFHTHEATLDYSVCSRNAGKLPAATRVCPVSAVQLECQFPSRNKSPYGDVNTMGPNGLRRRPGYFGAVGVVGYKPVNMW